jgi:hypothetical protein
MQLIVKPVMQTFKTLDLDADVSFFGAACKCGLTMTPV